jgi:hypothetical protein
MNSGPDPFFKILKTGRLVLVVICMGIGLDLVPDVFGVSKTREMPPGILERGKFPSIVPKIIRTDPFDQFTIRNNRTEPWLARKNVIERIFKHPHVGDTHHMRKFLELNFGHVGNFIGIADHDDRITGHVRETL